MREATIPDGWISVELGEIADTQLGKMLSQKARKGNGSRPYLRNLNVRWHGFDLSDLLKMDFSEREVAKYQLRSGDVLICEGGEPGRAAVWKDDRSGVLYQKALHRVRIPEDLLDPELLVYQLELDAKTGRLHRHFTGSTIDHLPQRELVKYRLRIPPRGEQREIRETLDTHFTRLDAAVSALDRAGANLKRYRASVLKAACGGRLVPTEAELARREGRDYEPADVLLDRILAERRTRWEREELEKLKAKGKEPKDDRWKKKYREPEGPDTSGLPELPEGWVWASMEQLSEVSGGLTQHRRRGRLERSIPYLRVANVYSAELRLDDVQEMGVKEAEIDRVLLQVGDLLIVEGNGSLDQIGRVAIWDGSVDPCAHQNHLIKARLIDRTLSPYVLLWLLSPPGRRHVTRVASSTSGLYTLSLTKVRALPVAIPPAAEVDRIVCEVDRQLSFFEATTGSLEREIARASRLRQSLLERAFEGRLVPQDVNDKPASALLDHIQAEHEPASSSQSASTASSTRT